jgi:aerobic carbon-monoxide dehydrogenase large subunit
MKLTRQEDAELIQGSATYVADLYRPGDACMVVVRSDLAHGRILSLDVEEARAMDGVLGVFTGEDVARDLGSVPRIGVRITAGVDVAPWLQPVIATDVIRYVGEPIAIVVAADRYLAEDAAEMVFAEIEPLDVSLEIPDSEPPRLFDQGNEVATINYSFGDLDSVFETAPVRVQKTLSVARHSAVPLETRGLYVEFDPGSETIVVNGATKVVHWNRNELARHLGLPIEHVVLRETSVGGGFGVRGEFYPEDTLTSWAAWKLRRTVSWVEDRREHFIATNHARHQVHVAELAGDEDGNILGARTELWVDLGAYVRTNGMRIAEVSPAMLPGPYLIPAYSGTAHAVVTNQTPTGTYRAPGRYESTFVCERLIDSYASRISADPREVRRKNLIKRSDMPYVRDFRDKPSMTFEEGDYEAMFSRVLSEIDPESVEERRARGELVGVGATPFIESTRLGPWEAASVAIDPDGRITVRSGGSSVGQGFRTMLAMVVGRIFGVDPDVVTVAMLDTGKFEKGVGSYASRSTSTAGSAAHMAATEVARRCTVLAAEKFGVDPSDIELGDGHASTGSGDRLPLSELAALAGSPDTELTSVKTFSSETVNLDFGTVAVIARVDPVTAGIHIEKLVVGFETGTVINRPIVEGQLVGAAMQGVGGALLEQFRFDEEGNPLVTSFMDYLMPTISEAPEMTPITFDDLPSSANPLGTKGVGEGGITGVGGAAASAIENAISATDVIASLPVDIETVMTVIEDEGRGA